jgi:hypothetical protein
LFDEAEEGGEMMRASTAEEIVSPDGRPPELPPALPNGLTGAGEGETPREEALGAGDPTVDFLAKGLLLD